ncbi:hypothetical protein Tsubulata_010003 [Turnera subulata]|uniref:Uncharacterized protein n=1 Tax=Turnera subulata TaxID=218843 RepID=A0A9Q0FPS8_9ROSI|nr:hypothetical protein Tsubulata_012798 [Turnera subulata]KAJ4836962.1 hypothetical protein Tsubulata_010003 [Turnera subulata]
MINLLVLVLFTVLSSSYIIFQYFRSPLPKSRKPLPPGPKPWPIVGNILHIGKLPHISMAGFSKVHGPLISLKLGTRTVVVASSPAAATEILRTQDRSLSGRIVAQASRIDNLDFDRMSIIFAPTCTDAWKSFRAMCRTELFSPKAIETQSISRERKVKEMVEYLRSRDGKVVRVGEVVFATVINMLGNVIFSKDLMDWEDKEGPRGLKSLISTMVESAATPNIADFYPILAWLDPQGLRKNVAVSYKQACVLWKNIIKERRESLASGAPATDHRDFLDVFLSNGLDDQTISWLTMELLIAGSDTTTSTVEWAMTELLRNDQVLKKVCQELEKEVGNNVPLTESNVSQLPYLNACVKETLRLHPPAPFLVPRRALETCEVMGYTIPKDAQVLVNVWAIGRSPSEWEDPLSFKPERFLGSSLDYKGQHFEFLPFGAGRRICPGLPLANRQVQLILASLLRHFDWPLPDGHKLEVNEKFGIVLQKEQPLLFVPKPKQ